MFGYRICILFGTEYCLVYIFIPLFYTLLNNRITDMINAANQTKVPEN